MSDVYLSRWALQELVMAMHSHRIVSVVGCRQSGKTTLLENAHLPDSKFFSLDSDQMRQVVQDDVSFFLSRNTARTVIIDEVQKAPPSLIGEIKYIVDRKKDKGQFILTGSSDFRKLPQAKESLAGRVTFVRVRTFTHAEKLGKQPGFLHAIFDGKLPATLDYPNTNKIAVLSMAIDGGFPELLGEHDREVRSRWYNSYLSNQILLDARDQWGARKSELLKTLLEYAAAYSSKLFSVRGLTQLVDTSWKTLSDYLSAIEAMYLVDLVPGWDFKDYDRPGKSPKLLMTDTGLMAHLLGLKKVEDIIDNHEIDMNEGGKLVESWVYNQLAPEVDLHPSWTIHHFRNRTHEIDFLITDDRGHMIGVEVKSGQSVSSKDFDHLRWFAERREHKNFTGIILYAGNRVTSGGDNCYALPMEVLWDDYTTWHK